MKEEFKEHRNYKSVTQEIARKLDTQGFKYRKNMCSKGCKYYENGKCLKKRSTILCAKKGLKNKE